MRLVNTCGLPGETSSLSVSNASLVQECSSSSMAHELPGETSLLSVSNASVVQECCSSFSRGESDYYWRQTLPLRGCVILAKIDVLPDGNLAFPSHGELFQHEVLFYVACPTFPSHSRRYLFVLHREGDHSARFPFVAGFLHVNSGNLHLPCLRGMDIDIAWSIALP